MKKTSQARPAWVPQLLRWYRTNKRDLPWRKSTDPYRVWVSEVMLQQTQVATVIPYYERFLKKFSTVQALAAADLQEVLTLWEGLGYYSRCRNFHRAARELSLNRNGRFPDTAEGWKTLPGIGAYTAAALASIVNDEAVPVVDGNVIRVMARFWCLKTEVKSPALREEIRHRLQALVPRRAAGDFNQAMMELGALICRPGEPVCSSCPLRKTCGACRQGLTGILPVKAKKKAIPHKDVVACVIMRKDKVLIAKRPAEKMLGGLWEFPGGKLEPGETEEVAAVREIREELGLTIAVERKLCLVKHTFSHFKMSLHAHMCRVVKGRVVLKDCDDARWVGADNLRDFPMPVSDRKIARQVVDLLSRS